ncbi:MAG: aminotransferase class V-fold PLP-dependent enzyme [bacterium]|nr:aminotransferase class V-fold PLP-dependent enzyme [bacterium]
MIYLDNAATTLKKPPQVIEAVVEAMRNLGNSSRGTHAVSLKASRAVYDVRRKIAEFFGCPRLDHTVFTCNATEALNIAIFGTFTPHTEIITTDLEHNSVLRPLYALEAEHDVKLKFVPANSRGQIDYVEFERLITSNTRAIICTHASNVTGNSLDIAQIGRIAHKHGLLFIVDASQTAGDLPLNLEQDNIDILCFTGHKGLMGPQGTGGLCFGNGVEIRPWKRGGSGVQSYLHEQPSDYPVRLEAGTLNGHGLAGLGAALEFIESVGLGEIGRREEALTRRFYEGVSRIDGVTVYGDFEKYPRAAIVSINIEGYDSSEVSFILSENYGIATRPGAHCAPRMHKALRTAERGTVRFSFSYFTEDCEIERALEAVEQMAQER